MSNRRKILIIVLVILIIVAIFLVWWFFLRQPAAPAVNLNANQALPVNEQIQELPPPSETRQNEEKNYPLGLKQLAFSFAERFGTYSSDAPAANLKDLELLMTARMWSKTEAMIAKNVPVNGYDAYEAKALTSKLESSSKEAATLTVNTQRIHIQGSELKQQVYYQSILLKFVLSGNEWKVDDAVWQ
ncbi:MAG: hypothetical protein AAB358_01065 [Patescibacteria group bacterium]